MKVYVLDTETTGLCGAPEDHVVDVGVVELDFTTGAIRVVYSEVVGYDVQEWDHAHRDAWVFNHTDLTLEDVAHGLPCERVRSKLVSHLLGETVCCYNNAFDLYKFLYRPPWSMRDLFTEGPDIMLLASQILKIPGRAGQYKWPKLEEAYNEICPDDPLRNHGQQKHRALSDALMAAHILIYITSMAELGLEEVKRMVWGLA